MEEFLAFNLTLLKTAPAVLVDADPITLAVAAVLAAAVTISYWSAIFYLVERFAPR